MIKHLPSHAATPSEILVAQHSSQQGLTQQEAAARLAQHGRNTLPESEMPGLAQIFARQFASPLIYALVAAAILSAVIREWSDASFIAAVLVINAVIGTIQEYSAQRSVAALHKLVSTHSRVIRDGDSYEIDAEELVPGDIVMLESGDLIPADIRLLNNHDLAVDESLLTGESEAIVKDAGALLPTDTPMSDRRNLVFAGTLVNRGRGLGVVFGTALDTELGTIASAVLSRPPTKAPLLVRMERFTHWVALLVGAAALVMAAVALSRGMPLSEILLLSVALAVSVIPEGLPVALTVALAISMRRMARRNVIVRRLVAVESLGSCTFIATDKTGTLTENQLTVRRIVFPGEEPWEITGSGTVPEGDVVTPHGEPDVNDKSVLERLALAGVLANDGMISHRDGSWVQQGDAVDIAMLVMAHKVGVTRPAAVAACTEVDTIPFESERLFCASLNRVHNKNRVFVKGALERLLPMCTKMAGNKQDVVIDASLLEKQAQDLATRGYRVIALASGEIRSSHADSFEEVQLESLTMIGLVGMIDPLRPAARTAIASCRQAGIEVAMVTGDHPVTAAAIARELELTEQSDQLVTGPALRQAADRDEFDRLVRGARVFARVEPQQKLDIVQSLQRNGHFVAVSGDGANDAPALRAAQVGVAMGKSGTDVARETADLIIADDNFVSIVAGVEEGRVAYANVRKVIFLLISTGAAELVLFTLALLTGLPLPLLAVQLLWLNLVTNGIQDVALAFEPAEGDELRRPPRSPKESIFNRLMVERVLISALVMGTMTFLLFQWLLNQGYSTGEARNGTLLLMVLFENIHVFNCRSETLSVFKHNPLRNPILLFGTAAAQLIHIGAMYTPWLSDVLSIQPISPAHWLQLLGLALTVLGVLELHKLAMHIIRGRQ